MAHAKHAEVRGRYGGRCGYCGVSEEDVGGELCVDHYVPVTAGGDESDENLVYACFRCNLFKGEFCPTDSEIRAGRFVLHPARDDASEHLRLDERTGRLEPLTETGRLHITILRLNRPALVAHRLRRRYERLLSERIEMVEAENNELRAIIDAQNKYVARLRKLIEHGPDYSS